MATEAERIDEIVQKEAKKLTDGLTAGMLRDYVQELEEHKLKLVLNVNEYREKYEQQKADQADIYYYLNKKLDDNYEVIASLESQIINEQADREAAEKAYEKKIEELKTKLIHDEARHISRINDLEERLQTLKDFGDQKDEVDRNLDKLLVTLENERKQFRLNAEEMERRTLHEREKLRKEREQEVVAHKSVLESQIEEKLAKKTKKTRLLNKLMRKELAYQSKQAEHVAVINKQVIEKDRNLRKDLDIAVSTEEEMAKKLVMYQRLIKKLNEKIAMEESSNENAKNNFNLKLEEKDRELEALSTKLNEMKSRSFSDNKLMDDFWKATYRIFASLNHGTVDDAYIHSISSSTFNSRFRSRSSTRPTRAAKTMVVQQQHSDSSGGLFNVFDSTSSNQSSSEAISHDRENPLTAGGAGAAEKIFCELFQKILFRHPMRFKQLLRSVRKTPHPPKESSSLPSILPRQHNSHPTGGGDSFASASSLFEDAGSFLSDSDSEIFLGGGGGGSVHQGGGSYPGGSVTGGGGSQSQKGSVFTGILSWDISRSGQNQQWWENDPDADGSKHHAQNNNLLQDNSSPHTQPASHYAATGTAATGAVSVRSIGVQTDSLWSQFHNNLNLLNASSNPKPVQPRGMGWQRAMGTTEDYNNYQVDDYFPATDSLTLSAETEPPFLGSGLDKDDKHRHVSFFPSSSKSVRTAPNSYEASSKRRSAFPKKRQQQPTRPSMQPTTTPNRVPRPRGSRVAVAQSPVALAAGVVALQSSSSAVFPVTLPPPAISFIQEDRSSPLSSSSAMSVSGRGKANPSIGNKSNGNNNNSSNNNNNNNIELSINKSVPRSHHRPSASVDHSGGGGGGGGSNTIASDLTSLSSSIVIAEKESHPRALNAQNLLPLDSSNNNNNSSSNRVAAKKGGGNKRPSSSSTPPLSHDGDSARSGNSGITLPNIREDTNKEKWETDSANVSLKSFQG